MDNSRNKPDISQIEHLLGKIQPRPSEGFYRRMEMSPWTRTRRNYGYRKALLDKLLQPNFQIKALVIAVVLILVLALGFYNTPHVIAIAQQIASYILPADSDQLTLTYRSSVTVSPSAIETQNVFPLNIEEAEDIAGMRLKRIPLSVHDLTFNGARYDPDLKAVTMRYELDNAIILFTQRPFKNIKEYTSVGASAPVESLYVRGVEGEFVEGGWKILPENLEKPTDMTPDSDSNLAVIWDPDLPQRILRWQEDNTQFEILVTGTHNLGKSDIIKIADSIQ